MLEAPQFSSFSVGIILGKRGLISLCLLLLSFMSVSADVKSTSGTITFDVNYDGSPDAVLTPRGLGIGVSSPSANLQCNGNAIITGNLAVGTTQGSANLQLGGSLGFSVERLTSDATAGANSFIIADTSSSNMVLTLPLASAVTGRIYQIKKGSSQNFLGIQTAGSGNYLDHQQVHFLSSTSTGVLPFMKVISSGNSWHILSQQGSFELPSGNLVAWYRADKGVYQDSAKSSLAINDGEYVSVWEDQSGLSNDVTTAGNNNIRPQLKTSVLNGRAVVRFDGTDDYLRNSTFNDSYIDNKPFTVFMVMQSAAFTGISNALNGGAPRWYMLNTIMSYDINSAISLANFPAGFNITTYTHTGTQVEMWLGGVSKGTYTTGLLAVAGSSLYINMYTAAYPGPGTSADYAEIIIYNRTLITSERESVEQYLKAKYRL